MASNRVARGYHISEAVVLCPRGCRFAGRDDQHQNECEHNGDAAWNPGGLELGGRDRGDPRGSARCGACRASAYNVIIKNNKCRDSRLVFRSLLTLPFALVDETSGMLPFSPNTTIREMDRRDAQLGRAGGGNMYNARHRDDGPC